MGTKLYKPKRRKRKEKLYLIDRLEISGIILASAVILVWSGWSVVEAFKPEPVIQTYEVDTSSISEYLTNISTESETKEGNNESSLKVEENSAETTTTDATKLAENTGSEAASDTKNNNTKQNQDKTKKSKEKTKQTTEAENKTDAAESKREDVKDTEKQTNIEQPETTEQKTAENTVAQPAATPVYVAQKDLNIRKTPDTSVNNNIIANYKTGEAINVIEGDEAGHSGWYKVNKDGVEGYVAKTLVEVK